MIEMVSVSLDTAWQRCEPASQAVEPAMKWRRVSLLGMEGSVARLCGSPSEDWGGVGEWEGVAQS